MILRSSPAREKTTKHKNGRERKRSRRSSSNSGVLFPALVCFVVVVFSLAARCSFEVEDGAILLFPKVFARAASLEEEDDDGIGVSSSISGDGGDKMKAILNVLLERYASRHEGEELDADVKRLLFPSSSSFCPFTWVSSSFSGASPFTLISSSSSSFCPLTLVDSSSSSFSPLKVISTEMKFDCCLASGFLSLRLTNFSANSRW